MCRAGHRLEIQNICYPSVGYPVYSDESDRVGASGRWRLRDGGLWACGLVGFYHLPRSISFETWTPWQRFFFLDPQKGAAARRGILQ
jgi:hypothetical protein